LADHRRQRKGYGIVASRRRGNGHGGRKTGILW
jgi:hypothetical protein